MTAKSYEEIRNERIKRNSAFLASLGIQPLKKHNSKDVEVQKRKAHRKIDHQPTVLRRSTRIQNLPLEEGTLLQENPEENVSIPEKEKPKTFIASHVSQYIINSNADAEETTADHNAFHDDKLKRIYSMDFGPQGCPLLAAGGHHGFVRIHGTKTPMRSDPIMTFQAHRGWISSVSLAPSESGSTRLLTSSNDGSIKLWDLNQSWIESGKAKPKELTSNDTFHRSGIFSMHVCKNTIFTASKDGSIAVSRLANDELELSHKFIQNDGVIKCVESRDDGTVFASCGNSGITRVMDVRVEREIAEFKAASIGGCLNSLSWNPVKETQLCISGLDPVIEMWDFRQLSQPITEYRSCSTYARSKVIYQPRFTPDGTGLFVCFPNEKAVTMFETIHPYRCMSRGVLEYQPLTCTVDPLTGCLALSLSTGTIHLLKRFAAGRSLQ